jgi:hypothetical protein
VESDPYFVMLCGARAQDTKLAVLKLDDSRAPKKTQKSAKTQPMFNSVFFLFFSHAQRVHSRDRISDSELARLMAQLPPPPSASEDDALPMP